MKIFSLLGNIAILCFSGLALICVAAVALLLSLPDVGQLEKCMTTSMYEVKLCPGSDQYVRLKEISPYMVHAVIAAEDTSFYHHKGLDWHEIQASFNKNLETGKIARGGSTLTQQLAKNVFLNKEKSVWRKLKEAYLAHAIERRYKKDFILEKYLNVVEFGPHLYGVKAAANLYFKKPPSALTPLESVYLAFLLPNPKSYSKSSRTGELTPFAKKMLGIILQRMNAFGKLSPIAHQVAMAELPNFPWHGLTLDAFEGMPSYSFEAPTNVQLEQANEADTNHLEELLEEELRNAPEVVAPTPKEPTAIEEESGREPESDFE